MERIGLGDNVLISILGSCFSYASCYIVTFFSIFPAQSLDPFVRKLWLFYRWVSWTILIREHVWHWTYLCPYLVSFPLSVEGGNETRSVYLGASISPLMLTPTPPGRAGKPKFPIGVALGPPHPYLISFTIKLYCFWTKCSRLKNAYFENHWWYPAAVLALPCCIYLQNKPTSWRGQCFPRRFWASSTIQSPFLPHPRR